MFFCYDHMHSIIRNTQLLYMLLCSYWLPNSNIPEIFHNSTTIAFYLNYTEGLLFLHFLPQVKCLLNSLECYLNACIPLHYRYKRPYQLLLYQVVLIDCYKQCFVTKDLSATIHLFPYATVVSPWGTSDLQICQRNCCSINYATPFNFFHSNTSTKKAS